MRENKKRKTNIKWNDNVSGYDKVKRTKVKYNKIK